ncbi:MAG: asparagine synthase (glutamine-hydrolyzing) [Acidobacteriota bacterium]|nr:asparagine synthase (glutamine-hydrolyzing) [Acidobacteriota bacterium]
MCGISGIVGRQELSATELERIRVVNQALLHRGPDGDGYYSERHIALAMRRLSIIDLAGGWQPLYNEDRSLALVANGEIYNFVELRQRLQANGHHFNTGSDCETILHLYEEYGADCVHHLRGMFAFALWDSKRQRLLLARDRMGEKPLYLYERNGQLLFASELKSLLRSGMTPFELDPVAVNLYFHYQFVPEPMSPLKGVRKLDAAHLLIVDVVPWRIEERCYWRMEDAPPLEGNPAQLIREELETVSALIIRSDVPVGVALSGGLDSSAIAALAVSKYPGVMHAFSVGYPGRPSNDERAEAQHLADHLGMPFHDVELETGSMVEFFPDLVYLRDDPIADISGYGYYAVSKLAREHGVPVMLQGQGGDELFWGYPWVQQGACETLRKASLWRNGWRSLPEYLEFSFPEGLSRQSLSTWARSAAGARSGWQQFQRYRASPDQMVFYDLTPDFSIAASEVRQFYGKALMDGLNGSDATRLFTLPQPWPDVGVTLTKLICDTYLRENGITQGDRLSMASSIELRLPLIDYRLVEIVIGLRKGRSDISQPPKAWFKAALKNVLPPWIMDRPKRGFAPPVREWHEHLFAAYGNSLADGYLTQCGVLSQEAGHLLAAGPYPPSAIAPISFKALVLEQWSRQMLKLCFN